MHSQLYSAYGLEVHPHIRFVSAFGAGCMSFAFLFFLSSFGFHGFQRAGNYHLSLIAAFFTCAHLTKCFFSPGFWFPIIIPPGPVYMPMDKLFEPVVSFSASAIRDVTGDVHKLALLLAWGTLLRWCFFFQSVSTIGTFPCGHVGLNFFGC